MLGEKPLGEIRHDHRHAERNQPLRLDRVIDGVTSQRNASVEHCLSRRLSHLMAVEMNPFQPMFPTKDDGVFGQRLGNQRHGYRWQL